MKLADLRKLSIRKHMKIRFQMSNGMECVITEHGLAQIPALKQIPDFNVEQELCSVSKFVLEPVNVAKKPTVVSKSIDRQELTSMIGASPSPALEHEEE
jgi:hypothetical protein